MFGKKRILLAIALVIIAVVTYVIKEYNRANKNIADEESAFSVDAVELVKSFVDDDSTASRKYVGKIISVSGFVKNMNQDERGYYTLSLGDTTSMSSVRCSIDSIYTAQATPIKPGMKVTVKGNCTGYNEDELLGLDVIVNRCVIEEE